MKTITKVALSTMTLVAVAAGSVAGTLAYLQSQTPVATNVMASGGVEIKQLELQRKEGVEHIKEAVIGDLVPFQQNQVFAPAHPVEGASNPYTAEPTDLFKWGPYVTADGAANGLWNDDKLKGVIDKFVFVENTGDSACYYRTLIAFECPEDTEYSEGSDKEFMMNVNGSDLFDWEETGYITVGGTRYLLTVATYTEPLAAKEISRPSLLQVVMTHNATNEDVEKLNGEYEILVMSQACQTENFDSADAALDKIFGAADTTNATKWFSDSLGIVTVSTADELAAAVANGGTVVLNNDIELTEGLTIPAGVETELIIGDYNISLEKAQTGTYAMIVNKGTLTISGDEGVISYADTTTYSEDNGYASNTISNHGVLNIEGGTIENVSSENVKNNGYPHAIDAYQGSVTNITGGTVKSANYDCIRMFCNSETLATTVNISGGNIINRVSFQDPAASRAGYGILNITGGTFTTTDDVNANVRLLNFSNVCSNMNATISGGTFDKGVKTQNFVNAGVTAADWLTIVGVDVTVLD